MPIVMVLGGGYSDQAWQAQYRSIKSLLSEYGKVNATSARKPSVKEKAYVK